MKTITVKKILMGAMLAIVTITSSYALTGCLVCRDCGPRPRHFR